MLSIFRCVFGFVSYFAGDAGRHKEKVARFGVCIETPNRATEKGNATGGMAGVAIAGNQPFLPTLPNVNARTIATMPSTTSAQPPKMIIQPVDATGQNSITQPATIEISA